MKEYPLRQSFKLKLLALILALVLMWYALNPVPNPIFHDKPVEKQPDEKLRDLHTQPQRADVMPGAFGKLEAGRVASCPSDEDIDDFEWPEFIDG